jgi:hypothetical protein
MPEPIYVLMIDIKDGWFDAIYAFRSKADAERHAARLSEKTSDAVIMSAVELDPPFKQEETTHADVR